MASGGEAPLLSVEPGKSDQSDDVVSRADDPTSGSEGGARRLVEIRCGFADMARKEAESAAARVTQAWTVYDQQAAVVTRAQAEIDLAAIRADKEDAHRVFRSAVAAAQTRGQVEAAAANWLAEINQVNSGYRLAQARVQRELEAAESLLSELTKLSDAAEASATMADAATQACREAQAALAASSTEAEWSPEPPAVPQPAPDRAAASETAALPESAPLPPVSAPAPPSGTTPWPGLASATPAIPAANQEDEDVGPPDSLVVDLRSPQAQAIVGLLRRDSGTMTALVDRLAGSDPTARSRWQLLLSTFVDALVAAAMDDAWFEFPQGNPFWDQFPQEQAREITRNLAAVGFRYDGFGAWVDRRVPDHRDLAMAVGGAGLLPVRVRVWPRPEEAARLLNDVRVSADQFVASRAPALTLGELLRLIGRRAELLADLWNEWPRVRLLLFATRF
jgi:flagellar basal body rod protein FlgC